MSLLSRRFASSFVTRSQLLGLTAEHDGINCLTDLHCLPFKYLKEHVKFALEQAMMAQRESRGIALLFL